MLTNDSELKQSLIMNHEQSTKLNQDALKLPKIETEKGRRSMFTSQRGCSTGWRGSSLIALPRLGCGIASP